MNRSERHLASQRPYAVDLSSWRRSDFTVRPDGGSSARQTMRAIWFRRKKGATVAHVGTLWDYSAADSPADFLQLHDDGRYGGDWIAAWDGESAWSQHVLPKTDMDSHTEILSAALARFLDGKQLPEGYDGWWSF